MSSVPSSDQGIGEHILHFGFCDECEWYGEDQDNEEAAQRDLDDHNREQHGVMGHDAEGDRMGG